jgi:hypothetical protein
VQGHAGRKADKINTDTGKLWGKYFPTAYGKEVIAAGLAIKNLVLIPALA